MSAITFPNSPTPGTQTTVNGITYTFTDGTWVAVGQSNFYSLPTASAQVLGGVKGGGTDITVANDGVISFSGTLPGPKTFTFTVTGNGQTTVNDPQTGLNGAIGDYTITGSDRRGIVSGTNPTIHINEEDTIIFNVTAAGQEFRLVWATAAPTSGPNVGGFEDIGTNSVSTNEATGQGSGTVTWVSKEQDGDSLYQGGSNYYYQDCDQNFTNNPTTYKFGTIKVFHKDTPEGKSDWLELNDTPNSYAGQAGKFTKVNAGENALEFTDSPVPVATSTVLGGVKGGGTGIEIAADGLISLATGSTFDTNDVDSHLNQSNPTADYVLSWSGTDYAWVEQSGGAGGGTLEHDMWWLATPSAVELGVAGAGRIGYSSKHDTIGRGDTELGDFGRVTQVGFEKSGNGMTEVNGIFTFPSTGHWRVKSTVHCYGRESGAQAGKFASAITYTSNYNESTNSTYNTYLECQGEPRTANQTAPSYSEIVSYYRTDWTTVWNGNDPSRNLDNVFDGSSATYTEMHTSHADISYLYLTQGQLTDVVKVVVGYDGDGWLGFNGQQNNPALMPRTDGGTYQYGVNGSPQELIMYDGTSNNTPAFSGQLESLTFTGYTQSGGSAPGGAIKGATSVCHLYYIKIQRLTDNVLTTITYSLPAANVNWTEVNRQWSIMDSQIYPHFNEVSVEYVFNITDTSTQKVKFEVSDATTCMQIDWNNDRQSRFFFSKLEGAQGLQGDPGASTTINNNAADRVILGSATADTLNADNGLTYTRQGSNTSGKPLLTVGTVTDGDAYLDVIAGRQTATGEDKKIQLRSTDTYAYLYASCDNDFHIEHNRDPAYRTAGAKIRIGAVGDHNAIFELSGESILNHAGNEKIKTTTDGVKITGGIQDKDNQLGTNGQVLTSTGTQLDWVDASTLPASQPFTNISTDVSTSHTLLASDMGKVVKITSPGGGVNLQLTIPDLSASISFGDEVRIMNGANESISVDTSATTLYRGISGVNGGTGGYSTGNRQIAGYSLITLTYRGNNQWNIHGDGVF